MIKINVFTTNSKLVLKGLILNEDKTFIIGKVQNKNSKLDYISTKWEIDKKNKTCKCVLGDKDYDFSIEGIYIPGLYLEEKKVKKNFYTFNKDAWHCKLYKWVYGKEPHKVHPTMCPYFWIMVVTLLPPVFLLILIVKMFGKTGTKFLETLSTYKARKKSRQAEAKRKKIDDWVEYVKKNWDKVDNLKLDQIMNHQYWDSYKYDLGWDVMEEIKSKNYRWRMKCREEKIVAEHQSYLQEQEKKRITQEKRIKFQQSIKPNNPITQVDKKKVINKNSKTAKIIGIGLITIFISFAIWVAFKLVSKAITSINWSMVGQGLLVISYVVGGLAGIYLIIIYLLIPFYTYILFPFYEKILVPLCNFTYNKILVPGFKYLINYPFLFIVGILTIIFVKPTVWCGNKIADADYGWFGKSIDAVGRGIAFIAGLIVYPFIMLYRGFLYMIEFFKMCKDLIYQMYKKNCPVITWTAGDISDEEYNIFIDTGKVDYNILLNIANKIKMNESLTQKETAIFTDRTSIINNIIAGN